jgi:hypothetical protein
MDEIISLLKNLTNTQVAVILVGVVVLYLMRGGASLNITGWLSSLWAKFKPTTTPAPAVDGTPDANAVAAAYKTLSPYLTADTREVVRSEVADAFLSTFDPEA